MNEEISIAPRLQEVAYQQHYEQPVAAQPVVTSTPAPAPVAVPAVTGGVMDNKMWIALIVIVILLLIFIGYFAFYKKGAEEVAAPPPMPRPVPPEQMQPAKQPISQEEKAKKAAALKEIAKRAREVKQEVKQEEPTEDETDQFITHAPSEVPAEPHVAEEAEVLAVVEEEEIEPPLLCKYKMKNGKRCSASAGEGGYCNKHMKRK